MYISEKHDSNNIIYDIENLEKNEKRNLKPYFIKNSAIKYNHKIKKMEEDITKVNFKESGNSIYYMNSVGCEIFMTECELLKGSNYIFENVPKMFYIVELLMLLKTKIKNVLYIVILENSKSC